MNGSGTVTTAGGLVFAASDDGEFKAFSADKGEKLWSVKLQPGMANPATYMIDGKQYVSILAGRSGHGRMYTFALDAKEPMPGPASGAPAATAGSGAAQVPARIRTRRRKRISSETARRRVLCGSGVSDVSCRKRLRPFGPVLGGSAGLQSREKRTESNRALALVHSAASSRLILCASNSPCTRAQPLSPCGSRWSP